MSYMKRAIYKVQHQFHLTKTSPTASSPTNLYKAYQKLRTCAFICVVIDADKNNFMFIVNKENTILTTIHQNITPQNITFQFNLTMYPIPSKSKQKLYLNYQNYLRHCKGVFKHIYHQPLKIYCITNLQCNQCQFCQF